MLPPAFTVQFEPLSSLSLSEQAVYARLVLMAEGGKVTIRCEELARLVNVSRSTLKRAIHSLRRRGLVKTTWKQKTPMTFSLTGENRDIEDGPRLYDSFDEEDRDLFLSVKQSLPPAEIMELEEEAIGQGRTVDELIFRRMFGPDKQRKYERMFGKS